MGIWGEFDYVGEMFDVLWGGWIQRVVISWRNWETWVLYSWVIVLI
jgi:hypothetical protein